MLKLFNRMAFFLALVSAATIALVFVLAPSYAYAAYNGKPVVVSMGDSYSSGEGVEDFYAQEKSTKYEEKDWLAHRSKEAWPGLLSVGGVKELRQIKGNGWYFVASSGAKTNHLRGDDDSEPPYDKAGTQTKEWDGWDSLAIKSGSKPLPCQLDVFQELPSGSVVDYVTFTIGGNDLGFARIVAAACMNDGIAWLFGHGDLDAEINQAIEKFESVAFTNDLLATYDAIAAAAGEQAHLLIVGYPHLFPREGRAAYVTGTWFGDWTVFDMASVSAEDAEIINLAVDLFDVGVDKLVAGTRQANWHFVDPRDEFDGHEIDYINPMWNWAQKEDLDQTDKSAYSAHPTKEGQEAYARAVQRRINQIEEQKGASQALPVVASPAVAPPTDLSMSLVFDVSGSMDSPSAAGVSKLSAAKIQSTDFVNAINRAGSGAGLSSVKVGVASFDTYGYENSPLSTDPNQVIAAINSLSLGDMTNMYEGMEIGINQLRGTSGEKMMVFLSDGMNNEGHDNWEVLELAQQAADEGIKIFTIGFGPQGDLDEDLLREIADITSGTYSHEDASEMNAAAVGVFATMLEASMNSMGTVVQSATGAVTQGQTTNVGTFQVEENGTLTSYLYWPGSVLDMILLDPKGVEVKEGYPGFSIDTSTIPTTITVANAMVGAWTMSVFGREVSMENEPFWVGSVLAPSAEVPAVSGGSVDNSGGMVILLLVLAVAAVGGVYALSVRNREGGKTEKLDA